MSFRKYVRRYYSKRSSKSVKHLAERKHKYNLSRALPRIRAWSKRTYG